MAKSKSSRARKLDPRALARELVERRLEALLCDPTCFFDPGDARPDDFKQLRDALLEEGWPGGRAVCVEFVKRFPAESQENLILQAIADAHHQAGYLIGLELGRRLGGAR